MMLYRSLTALALVAVTAVPASAQDQRSEAGSNTSLNQPVSATGEDVLPSALGEGSKAAPEATPTQQSPVPASPATEPTDAPSATEADASKPERDVPQEAETASAAAPAAAVRPATAETGAADAVPGAADPLTPPPEDTSPTRAPGARERSAPPQAVTQAVTQADPLLDTVRSRLEGWPDGRTKADRDDLAALKAFYGASDASRIWTTPTGLTPRADAVTKALARAGDWGLDAGAFELPAGIAAGAAAETVADAEIRFGLDVLKYARFARGGRLDPGAISKIIDMRPRLYEPLSVIEAVSEASSADDYLESLHPRHPGFVALKRALAKLRGAPSDAKAHASDERRIVANMERWRWLPDDLGAFYVWDNVPEQVARVFHDGKLVHHAKIVVGKPSTPTPVFSMPMRFIIFNPTWGVPDGIKSNELAPMLRRAQANASSGWFFSDNEGASRVLRRQQLRVYSGGREINPDSINWSSTDIRRYTFVQPASDSNVLGAVKFRFPNKHDVYMHDTSQRYLFARSSRAFSHGCMRVDNPLKLAEVILAYDKGWSRSRIDQLVARGTTHDVTLDKKVNVHITYFTATADETGKLHTHPDIYGLDSRVASALAGRSVVLSSAKASADVAPVAAAGEQTATAPGRRTERHKTVRRPVAAAAPSPAPARPWNPFSTTNGN